MRERRIAVDESGVGNAGILIPPEPAPTGKIQKQVSFPANFAPLLAALAVIFACVIDVTPPILQAMRCKRCTNEIESIARISRFGVGNRIEVAFACVFQIPDIMAKLAQAEQVHE